MKKMGGGGGGGRGVSGWVGARVSVIFTMNPNLKIIKKKIFFFGAGGRGGVEVSEYFLL